MQLVEERATRAFEGDPGVKRGASGTSLLLCHTRPEKSTLLEIGIHSAGILTAGK